MKGSTKLLIVAAALLVAGILLSAIGYGLGAMTLTWGEDGLTIDPTQRAGIGLAALDLQEDILTSGAKTEIDIQLDGAVRELEVEGSVGSIEVQPGEDWSLEGYDLTAPQRLQYQFSDGKLTVSYDLSKIKTDGRNRQDRILLTYPQSLQLDEFILDGGVGEARIQKISSKEMELVAGVGSVEANEVQVSEKLEVYGGVGAVQVSGSFGGEIELSGGVGEISLTVQGAQEDEFDCHIDSGVGQIRFGGKNVGLLDEEYTVEQGREKSISVDGGVGDIEVYFEK